MALDPGFVGRTYAPSGSYQVGREKVREFASAIGETSAACHDVGAALALGQPDVIAPVTFAVAIVRDSQSAVFFDPDLGLDWSRVVHGDQGFSYTRPLHAGDEVVVTTTIESIKSLAGNEILGLRSDVATLEGEAVCSVTSTLVVRAPDVAGA
jgi:acyl dehydratase